MLVPCLVSIRLIVSVANFYLGSPNELPGPSDAPSLDPAAAIETHVPCSLDQILKLQDRRDSSWKMLVSFGLCVLNERDLSRMLAARNARFIPRR